MSQRRALAFTESGTPLVTVEALNGDGTRNQLPSPEEVHGTRLRIVNPGGPEELQPIEIEMVPNLRVVPHSHEEDEIFYVLEGELRFGARICPPGASIHIPARTIYGFTVGPSGVRFLSLRRRRDLSYRPSRTARRRHRVPAGTT